MASHDVNRQKMPGSADLNLLSLYQAGQDTVQEISQKAQELFQVCCFFCLLIMI